MPRSSTIWAAALLLASLSGSGPMLTTAEAMPAPGPQQTAMRPRYYFPRQVKRQIVTNSTAPASSTSSSSSSSSTPDLQSRQSQGDLSSFFESFFHLSSQSSSSSSLSASSELGSSSPDATSTMTVVVTPVPVPASSGTGNAVFDPSLSTTSSSQQPSPVVPSSDPQSSNNFVGSTAGLPETIIQSTSAPEPPAQSSNVAPPVISSPANVGSTGGIPDTIIPASSAAPPSVVQPTGISTAVPDVPEASSGVASTGGIPSSIVLPSEPATSAPAVAPTGGIPSTIVQPSEPATSAADSPLESSDAVPTGGIPASIVTASPSVPSAEQPSPTGASTILGPFIIPGSTGGIPTTVVQPSPSLDLPISSGLDVPFGSTGEIPAPTGLLPSDPLSILPSGSTGGVPVVLPTSDINFSSGIPLVSLPTSGIVVGITTAFGTSAAETPTPTTGPAVIPTSESKSDSEGLPLSDTTAPVIPSSVPGVSDSAPGPTAPSTGDSSATPIPILPTSGSEILPLPSSLPISLPDLSSMLSSIVSDLPTIIPVPTGTAPLPTVIPSTIGTGLPSGLPTSLSVPISVPTSESTLPLPSTDIPTILPPTSTGISLPIPSSGVPTLTVSGSTSGIVPPSSGTGVTSAPTAISSTASETIIPTSEEPSTTLSTVLPSDTSVPPSSANGTTSQVPISTPKVTPSSTSESEAITIPFTPPPTKTGPMHSILPTATNSETTYNVGSSILQQPSGSPTASATGIPSDMAQWISPPEGMPTSIPDDKFLGQIGFYFGLNYAFVSANDGGNQIFTYLKKAVADGLGIEQDDVVNYGLRAVDTSQWQGFITTLAVFMIPKDLNSTLALQIRNPATPFWHNKNETVNQLTSVVDPSWPLPYGKLPGDSSPSQDNDPAATATGGPADGGAIGGDMAASRRVNPTSVGIATGAVLGAMAYGAAMFFVARRYRNRRMAHQRSSSVPSTSRFTYGSMNGPAWMSGGRGPGRLTPGGRDSRGSRGSSSSNGRSVRTQQISAPVMAENSLGWN